MYMLHLHVSLSILFRHAPALLIDPRALSLKVANGEACIDGALGFTSPYYGGVWTRPNWSALVCWDAKDTSDCRDG